MAKSKNAFSSLSYDSVKKELVTTVSYLQSIQIDGLIDDIDFTITPTGGVKPSIISSIETKLKTYIILLFDITLQLEVIYKQEGVTEFLIDLIDAVRDKLNEIQEYFVQRHPNSILVRKAIYESPKTGKKQSFLAASKEDQIKCRSDVQKKVLQLLPKLEALESIKQEVLIKGDKDLPPSLIGLI